MKIITDLNVEVTMQGSAIIRVPYNEYFGKVQGVCGNIIHESNRYDCEDDEVSETTTTQMQTLPTSQTLLKCKLDNTDEKCEKMFDLPWLANYKSLIPNKRIDELIVACKVDYCINPTLDTEKEFIGQFVSECREASMLNMTDVGYILCDWEEKLTGGSPTCNENQEYKGCATNCDFSTCQDLTTGDTSCTTDGMIIGSCVCRTDHYLLNGDCVKKSVCHQTGWSKWSTWSGCSFTEKTRKRVRICKGPQCTQKSDEEIGKCTSGELKILKLAVDFHFFVNVYAIRFDI